MSILVEFKNFTVSFQNKICFHTESLTIVSKDRIALIGDNGVGKSSLIKALLRASEEPSDMIKLDWKLVIGYLPQEISTSSQKSVYDEMKLELKEVYYSLEAFEDILKRVEKGEPLGDEYDQLYQKLLSQDAFLIEHKIDALLEELDLMRYKNISVDLLSGGEKMRLSLAKILIKDPDLILLDEPTNHLDYKTKQWLISFLDKCDKAILVISHDLDLINNWPKTIWHIQNQKVDVFKGSYHDYLIEKEILKEKKHKEFIQLKERSKELKKLERSEKERQIKTEKMGKKKHANDPLVSKGKKQQAENTMGKAHKKRLYEEKEDVKGQLREFSKPKELKPRFNVPHSSSKGCSLFVEKARLGYGNLWVIKEVNFQLNQGETILIQGDNGSGKSTFFKALMNQQEVVKEGEFSFNGFNSSNIAYLDQDYNLLDRSKTVFENAKSFCQSISFSDLLRHLKSYLFLDERVMSQKVDTLSEGEKAKLSLALMGLQTPALLILDEVTNNMEMKTKKYFLEVLNQFPGALIINSHEKAFIDGLKIDHRYQISNEIMKKI